MLIFYFLYLQTIHSFLMLLLLLLLPERNTKHKRIKNYTTWCCCCCDTEYKRKHKHTHSYNYHTKLIEKRRDPALCLYIYTNIQHWPKRYVFWAILYNTTTQYTPEETTQIALHLLYIHTHTRIHESILFLVHQKCNTNTNKIFRVRVTTYFGIGCYFA